MDNADLVHSLGQDDLCLRDATSVFLEEGKSND